MNIKLEINKDNYLLFKTMKYSKNGYFDTKLCLLFEKKEIEIAKGRFDEEMGSLFYFRINNINKYNGIDFISDYERQSIEQIENVEYDFNKMYSLINGKLKLFLYLNSNGKYIIRFIKVRKLKDFSEKVVESKSFYLADDVINKWNSIITKSFVDSRKKILEENDSLSNEALENDLNSWIDCYK